MTVKRLRLRSARPDEPSAGGHAAAEHVGQTAAATLVEQDQQGQQEARDAEEHLQDELENLHEVFRSLSDRARDLQAHERHSIPACELSATSDADVLLEADDRRELVDQRGSLRRRARRRRRARA